MSLLDFPYFAKISCFFSGIRYSAIVCKKFIGLIDLLATVAKKPANIRIIIHSLKNFYIFGQNLYFMKKFIVTFLLCALACANLSAWGRFGHATVIAIAQRHLTEKTKANLAGYFDYDLQEDAVWMDIHRQDKPIAYTTAWHVYNVDGGFRYDPNPRLKTGDCIHAMYIADYNLKHYRELSDSAVVMNVRMLIHFAGDMHCPVHSYIPGPRNFWKCSLNGEDLGTFHGFYDGIPSRLWPDMSPDELAAQLDDCRKGRIRKICKGSFADWARDCGTRNAAIYEINAPLTERLDSDTVEKSRETVALQLRDAGYRLAMLLNLYFGK